MTFLLLNVFSWFPTLEFARRLTINSSAKCLFRTQFLLQKGFRFLPNHLLMLCPSFLFLFVVLQLHLHRYLSDSGLVQGLVHRNRLLLRFHFLVFLLLFPVKILLGLRHFPVRHQNLIVPFFLFYLLLY